jgi:hypothetical protein
MPSSIPGLESAFEFSHASANLQTVEIARNV